MASRRTSKRKTSRLRNWGFWVEYKRPGYLGVKVEKIASSALLDTHPDYRKELNKLLRGFRKKHGKIVVTDVVFGGKPSWGRHKLLKKTPKNEALMERRIAGRRRISKKARRRTSRR